MNILRQALADYWPCGAPLVTGSLMPRNSWLSSSPSSNIVAKSI